MYVRIVFIPNYLYLKMKKWSRIWKMKLWNKYVRMLLYLPMLLLTMAPTPSCWGLARNFLTTSRGALTMGAIKVLIKYPSGGWQSIRRWFDCCLVCWCLVVVVQISSVGKYGGFLLVYIEPRGNWEFRKNRDKREITLKVQ